MSEYDTDVRPGHLSLDETARCIKYVEIGHMVFVKSDVRREGREENVMSYATHDGVPGDFKLQLLTQSAPSGFVKSWQGRMFIEGVEQNVVLYREEAMSAGSAGSA